MKKLIYSIFTLLLLSFIIGSCSGDSYEKRLKKEKKAISGLIADRGFKIRYSYPKDHKFAENEYYFDSGTGIYFRVIHPGDTTQKPIYGQTDVLMRFDTLLYLVNTHLNNDSIPLSNDNNSSYGYLKLRYGLSSTYKTTNTGDAVNYLYLSPGCALPLDFGIGKDARVSLIVPFMNGSTYQVQNQEPFYYGRLSYKFNNQIEK